MFKSYKKMRSFWHDIKNFDKPNIPSFGEDEIIAYCFEFVLCDSQAIPRNIFIGASSATESVLCYEEDSPRGFGYIYGENKSIFKNLITELLNTAADLTYNMEAYKRLPRAPKLHFVNFYAMGRKGNFYKTLTYNEIHCKEHPYYPLFVYTKQLSNEIRKVALRKLHLIK